tara:strand:+ start:16284 stop:17363 length:1080 start_codon:yes stop_codon:yes gene_type:complete
MNGHIWASVDPIKNKVDVYPGWISNKIEKELRYNHNARNNYITISLGSKFFNATIHLKCGKFYQTTPPIFAGPRGGGKEPGYRTILPIRVINSHFTVYTKYIFGQWRICQYAINATHTFNETLINNNDLIPSDGYLKEYFPDIKSWTSDDLLEDTDNNKLVTVWMWCRGVPEKQGNIFKLSDSWWSPYFCEDNKIIDDAFNAQNPNVEITLFNNTKRVIEFTNDFSCYAKQVKYATENDPTHAVRMVKKVTITISVLKEKLKNLNKVIIDPSIITTLIDSDEIPHEFYCSISQDIMSDPVYTVDNHTYDRSSIERWFQQKLTSPLTGMYLSSNLLRPNNELKEQIQKFARLQIEKTKKK